jgi:PAS domain S-box-containing protein
LNDYEESRRAGARLAAEHNIDDPFAAAIRATRMAMIVTDPSQAENPIIFANDAFLRLTGYGRDEVIGRNCRFLQGPNTDPKAIETLRAAVAAGEDASVDLLNYRKDGSTFWNALYLSPVRNDAGDIVYFFGSQLDVSDRKVVELRARDRGGGVEHRQPGDVGDGAGHEMAARPRRLNPLLGDRGDGVRYRGRRLFRIPILA